MILIKTGFLTLRVQSKESNTQNKILGSPKPSQSNIPCLNRSKINVKRFKASPKSQKTAKHLGMHIPRVNIIHIIQTQACKATIVPIKCYNQLNTTPKWWKVWCRFIILLQHRSRNPWFGNHESSKFLQPLAINSYKAILKNVTYGVFIWQWHSLAMISHLIHLNCSYEHRVFRKETSLYTYTHSLWNLHL